MSGQMERNTYPKTTKPIVVAFSGGLDTCAILLWLKEKYDCDIIAYCAELGEGDDPAAIEARALELGATKFVCEDLREVLLTDFIWPMCQAGATYQKEYLLGTAIARPLIAKRLVEMARAHGAFGIVHGATGKGNDQIRFEKAWSYLAPDLQIIAPWKTWEFQGRNDLLEYLRLKGFTYEFPNKVFSIDENLWHVSYEGGPLEDLTCDFEDVLPQLKPKRTGHTNLDISFLSGCPTAFTISADGQSHTHQFDENPVDAFKALNSLGMDYAIGIRDLVEERVNGIKSRGIYMTPGGTLLYHALDGLKQTNWDHTTYRLSQVLASELGQIIYQGDWFTPARESLQSFFSNASSVLTGTITLRLSPCSARVSKRQSSASLYSESVVSFAHDQYGINAAALGYCETLNYKAKALGERANGGLNQRDES